MEKPKYKQHKEVTEQHIRNMFTKGKIQKIDIGKPDCSLIFVYLDIGHFELDSYSNIGGLVYCTECKYDFISISIHKRKLLDYMNKWGHFQ